MAKHLVLAGGGHAHMTVLANLEHFIDKGHQVSVIAPSPHHYYSGMGPGMMGGFYSPEQIRFATQTLVEKKGGKFILDRVERIDPEAKQLSLASGESLAYDVISFNIGSYVPKALITEGEADIFTVKPIENLIAAQKRILKLSQTRKITITIAGGGPSAVELAGNIWRITQKATPNEPRIQVLTGGRMLPRLPDRIRKMATASLERRGIKIFENSRVHKISPGKVEVESGRSFSSEVIFAALGIRPSAVFKNSGLATGPDGGLPVNPFLQNPQYPEIFGGGDCICFNDHPLDKVGVYAVRQNPILYHNLMAALEGQPLKPFEPGGGYLLIFNLGDGTGIFFKNRLRFKGVPAFKIKDYIDRKFMRKFQAFEQ